MKFDDVDIKIANTARAINRQIEDLASTRARLTRNIMILESGEVYEIENHLLLENRVQDQEKVLKDMLRHLDDLIKERDGLHT